MKIGGKRSCSRQQTNILKLFMLLFLLKLCSLDVVLKSVAGQYPEAVYIAISIEVLSVKMLF